MARDHPRLRGENVGSIPTSPVVPGSPPLARGKLLQHEIVHAFLRITPACAGKTSLSDTDKEHALGSPPLARGKHVVCGIISYFNRITPACAGKTVSSTTQKSI